MNNNQLSINPYDAVHNVLMNWCYENGFSDVIVRLNLDGKEQNELALFDPSGHNMGFEFNNDWWEGEDFVEVIGITSIHDVKVESNINKIVSVNGKIII